MFLKAATIAGAALCLALPAVAQTTTASNTPSTVGQPAPGMNGSSIRQHISMDLTKAGYSDVKVMPASFVATAKNKKGDDVTMLVTPDSVTTITDVPASGQSASNGGTAATSK